MNYLYLFLGVVCAALSGWFIAPFVPTSDWKVFVRFFLALGLLLAGGMLLIWTGIKVVI